MTVQAKGGSAQRASSVNTGGGRQEAPSIGQVCPNAEFTASALIQ